jgi:hypothetical protein
MKIVIGKNSTVSSVKNDDGTDLGFPVASLDVRLRPDEHPGILLGTYLVAGSEITIDGSLIKVVSLLEENNEDLHTNS